VATVAAVAAPAPVVRLAGKDDDRFGDALQSATVRQSSLGLDRLELEVVGFGDVGGGEPDYAFADVKLGDALELRMGGDEKRTVFQGEITALEERHGGGAPRLLLLAEDALHRLARARRSRAFQDLSVDDVVRQIASDAQLEAEVEASGSRGDWHQLNESSLAFLRRLLAPLDVPLRLVDGKVLRAKPFEPSGDAVELDAGDNVHHVRVVADLARQYTSVKARGRDLAAGDEVDHKSDALEPAPAGKSATTLLRELGWEGEAFAPQPAVADAVQAEKQALGGFARQNARFVHGELVCDGDPRLVPGCEIELKRVSPRFRGRYMVTATVHRFDRDHGYQTLVEVARGDLAP